MANNIQSIASKANAVFQPSSLGEYCFQMGQQESNHGNYQKAVTYFEKTIATDPEYAPAWHERANCLDCLGKCEDALKCYEQALVLDPMNSETWFNKGMTLKRLGRDREAESCMAKAMDLALGK